MTDRLRRIEHLSWDAPLSSYDAQAELLVPRAVAYSTALLERFFRGNMEISLPDEGVYGIVDHSTFTGTDAIQGFNGFSRVKLKLKNTTTAPAGSAPDAMGGGTLFAVLKFRRNTCYLDDLTGQQGAPAYRGPQCLTSVEETVVSNPSPSAVVGSNARQFTFDFNPALPINATSIYLQVVYRGQLGNEPDAVVVSTKDISEPTYITVENDSDYFRFNRPSDQSLTPKVFTRQQVNNDINLLNQVYPASCVVLENNTPPRLADNCFNGFNLQVGVSFNSLSMQSVLPPTRYLRVAVLSDMDSFTVHLASSACQLPADVSYPAVRMQSVLGTTYTSSFVALRNVFGWEIESCVASGDNQYPDPQADDRVQVMGALPEGSRLPYPVSILF